MTSEAGEIKARGRNPRLSATSSGRLLCLFGPSMSLTEETALPASLRLAHPKPRKGSDSDSGAKVGSVASTHSQRNGVHSLVPFEFPSLCLIAFSALKPILSDLI